MSRTDHTRRAEARRATAALHVVPLQTPDGTLAGWRYGWHVARERDALVQKVQRDGRWTR